MPETELARRVADELDVRNVLAKLAHLADDGDLDDYVELFTRDAVWEAGKAFPTRTGHDDIRKAAEERRAAGVAGPGTATRHVVSTSAVEIEGDHARARSVFRFYVQTDASPKLSIIGIYDDEFVRAGNGWKLAHRRIRAGA